MKNTIRDLVVDSASDDQIKEEAIKQGMKTLSTQGIVQLMEGSSTSDELLRVIDMREE
mgnify:CR=1 FL=1